MHDKRKCEAVEIDEDIISEIKNIKDQVNSLLKALVSSVFETDELTKNDSYNFIELLEDKVKELKNISDTIEI